MFLNKLSKYFYYTITLLAVVAVFVLIVLSSAKSVESAIAEHVVISEIMIEGDSSHDEFVELYNPTGSPVSLDGWRIIRRPSGPTPSEKTIVDSLSGTIPANGYFLIAHPEYNGTVAPDLEYSASVSGRLANNNAVVLLGPEVEGERETIDIVGMGTNVIFEGSGTVDNPVDGGSIERKAFSTSTSESMGPGGADENMGNSEDTDDNAADFVQREVSDPQNSSVTEIPASPSPSPSPTLTPTPTLSPSPTPTITIVPSPTPALSPAPSISPSPTPQEFPSFSIGGFFFPNKVILCRLVYRPIRFGFWWSYFPTIQCSR